MREKIAINRRTALKLGAAAGAIGGFGMPALAEAKTLRVAVAPYLPVQADTEKAYRPLNQYLADAVGMQLDMKVASDWAGVSTAISSGQSDIALMGPWGYALCHVKSGALIFATEKDFGVPTYKAIMVGKKGMDFKNFPKDSQGRSIALGDSGGFSAWMYPQYFFKQQGIDPRTYFKYTEGVAPAAIMKQVADGQLDIGVGWDALRWQMIKDGTVKEEDLPLIHESQDFPNGGYVQRADLDKGVVKTLQDALAAIDPKKARELGIPEPNDGFIADSHDSYEIFITMGKSLGLIS